MIDQCDHCELKSYRESPGHYTVVRNAFMMVNVYFYCRENDLKDNMYRCYLSLSGVTARNKKFQEALRLAKRAQYLAKEKADKSMEADAVLQLGQVIRNSPIQHCY